MKSKIIAVTQLVIYAVDQGGRAKWILKLGDPYDQTSKTMAEGTINLITNFCHVDYTRGFEELLNIDTDEVDIEGILTELIEDRAIRTQLG